MKYKIQINVCGFHAGWDDLLEGGDEIAEDNPLLTFHNHASVGDCTGELSAEARIEEEQEEYRDAYDHHTEEEIEEMMPDYRVVGFLEGDAETELRSMVKELVESFDVDSLDYQREVERRASDLLELLDKEPSPMRPLFETEKYVCSACGSDEWHANMLWHNPDGCYHPDPDCGQWCHNCEAPRDIVPEGEYEPKEYDQ